MPQPTQDPIAAFNAKVAETMTANDLDRRAATVKVARANPALHTAWVQATNPRNAHRIGGETPKSSDDAAEVFNQMVANKRAAGATRMQATKQVAKAHPALHRAYLKSTNPQNATTAALIDEHADL